MQHSVGMLVRMTVMSASTAGRLVEYRGDDKLRAGDVGVLENIKVMID